MDVRIEVRSAERNLDVPLLERLREWLGNEVELRGRIKLVLGPQDPEHMGSGALEGLLLSLGSGAAGALARSLPLWIRQQRSGVEIELTSSAGDKVRLKADNVRDAESLIYRTLDDQRRRGTDQ
ncbi:effector-associated constant component EACC1 [Streptomyces sp. NPDC054961]